jgi:hypothetical protein
MAAREGVGPGCQQQKGGRGTACWAEKEMGRGRPESGGESFDLFVFFPFSFICKPFETHLKIPLNHFEF